MVGNYADCKLGLAAPSPRSMRGNEMDHADRDCLIAFLVSSSPSTSMVNYLQFSAQADTRDLSPTGFCRHVSGHKTLLYVNFSSGRLVKY